MIHVYTDGACLGNPGPGGWGFVAINPEDDSELHKDNGSSEDARTTNNRMELMAAIRALHFYKDTLDIKVTIFTDSQYVQKGITEWISGWEKRGWVNSQKKKVENRDLWEILRTLQLSRGDKIDFKWVRGHAGNKWNEVADGLANTAAGIE